MRWGRISLFPVLAAFAVAVAPAPAAVTIGSNLGSNANSNNCGAADCTTTNLVLNGDLAANGLTSPVNGTVTSWRFKSGSNGNTVSLRVLRPGAGATFTGAGTSAAVTSVAGINGPFSTSLPILAGDHIGLNRSNGALVLSTDVGATQLYWTMPPLADGEARAGTVNVDQEVLVQAVVEPSNTLALGKPRLNKRKGNARLTIDVPNPGLLTVSGKGVKVAGLPNTTVTGKIIITIKAKGKQAKKLKASGKVGLKPVLTFTPTNGTAKKQSTKVTLKKLPSGRRT